MIKNWNLSAKLVVAFSILISFTAGSLTLGQYWQLRTSQRQAIKDRLLEIVQLAAPQIDSDYHSLVVRKQDASTVYYQINQKRLQSIQAASKDILHIYTVRQQEDGEYAYVIRNTAQGQGKATSMVSEPLEGSPPLLEKQTVIDESTTETKFTLNSAGIPVLYGYTPIFSNFNRLEGVLVVGLDVRSVLQREAEATTIALVTFAIILVITIGVVWYLAQSLVVRPTLKLNDVAQRLAEGDWDRTLPMERKDELGALARSFNGMAQQLKLSFQKLEDYSQNLEEKVVARTREVSEAQQFLNLVINNIPQSIFWKDRSSRFLGCNQSFAQTAGLSPEEIVGKTDYDMPWKAEESDFYVACDRRVMEFDSAEMGIVEPQRRADGTDAWLETSKVPLRDPQGEVCGILGIFQDITHYKAAENAANQANQAKSEFLANMSHELRTPLNGILGYAQILRRSPTLPQQERRGVDIIYECGSHLLTLINDILDLAKIEARRLDLDSTAVHLPSLLQSVVEICKVRADVKEISFDYRASDRLPEGVVADDKRLRQVLLNLLSNAIKFTEVGSVTLQADVLTETATEKTVLFRVIDTGVGIAAADISRLFQAFEQVGDRQKQAEGTGLGLAISQQIVEMMGSSIQIRSQLGRGSEFSFAVDFPLAEDWAAGQRQAESGDSITGYEGDRRQILVVDDHWENRAVLQSVLEPLGFSLTEAENGQEGLEKLRSDRPDLVIADLAMPVMDGFEMLAALRGDPELNSLPVIVSSASVSQTDQQMALDGGGDAFLAKPIQVNALLRSLEVQLDLTWQLAEPAPAVNASTEISEIIPLPAEELKTCLELVQEGRLKKLLSLTEAWTQQDETYHSFIEKVTDLARQFKLEELEEFLQQLLG